LSVKSFSGKWAPFYFFNGNFLGFLRQFTNYELIEQLSIN
jgi:hypothetical protein